MSDKTELETAKECSENCPNKYDFSKSCNCEFSPGETWCCNNCGLPTSKHSQPDLIGKLKEAKEIIEWYMDKCRPDEINDYQTFHDLGMNFRSEIESLTTLADKQDLK